ncbi:MAG: hypothetical protein HUU15_15560 [Candidatus Brocadiae bacterium]|nr:hypothetical protein [Candidatus Brocadiia bacterium]
MNAILPAFSCKNHPERFGSGLCMTCGRAVCAECTTKVDGINLCIGCLARRPEARETTVERVSRGAAFLGPAGIAASFLFFWAVFGLAGALVIGL